MRVQFPEIQFGDTLSIRSEALTLTGLIPDVSVLAGVNEEEIRIVPSVLIPGTRRQSFTPLGPVEEQTFTFGTGDYLCTWRVGKFLHYPAVTLSGEFYNGSSEAVRLREFALFRTTDQGITYGGQPQDWYLSSVSHSLRNGHLGEMLPSVNQIEEAMWNAWNMPIPYDLSTHEHSVDGRWRVFEDFASLYTDRGRTGLAIGPVGKPEADLSIEYKVMNHSLRLDVISRMTDILIAPGGARSAQSTILNFADYNSAFEGIFRWLATTHGSRVSKPPLLGWCSWYDLASDITSETIDATLTWLEHNHLRLPMQTIQVDDGYQKTVGDWSYNDKFPNGLSHFIERVNALGALPGIWIAPLAVHESVGLHKTYPEWFQRKADGSFNGEANNWGPRSRWLDPTYPDARTFIGQAIAEKWAEGFRYFKIDFNTLHNTSRFYDPTKTRLQVFRDLYRLYRETIGEEGYLVGCTAFTRGVFGYVDAARIGPDSVAIWRAGHPCTIEESIRAVGMSAIANGIFFNNDPDVTYAKPRRELTEAEFQTWHGFVGLLGGMMLISEPMQKPEYEDTTHMIELLYGPAPERARGIPGGISQNHTTFGFACHRAWNNSHIGLLWNPEDNPSTSALDIMAITQTENAAFHLWSFWDGQYLGVFSDQLPEIDLPSHGSLLYCLTQIAPDDRPVLIGTTLHISMGAAEISDVESNLQGITIYLNELGALNGSLFIYSTHPLTIHQINGCYGELSNSTPHVWQIMVRQRDRSVIQQIALKVDQPQDAKSQV